MTSHLSEQQISEWIAGQRSREAACHVLECPECAAEVGRTEKALLLFRESGFQCAEYWREQPQARPPRRIARWVAAGVAAASALLAVTTLTRPAKPGPEQEVFLQIPYVIPPAPYERTSVVRMDVPVAALIAAGLKMDAAVAGVSVAADVMVGQDGRPLAVAFPENLQ